MNSRELLENFLNISNAADISDSIIRTVYYDDDLGNDRLEWLLAGALEQIAKIKQAAESIDGVMREKENYAP